MSYPDIADMQQLDSHQSLLLLKGCGEHVSFSLSLFFLFLLFPLYFFFVNLNYFLPYFLTPPPIFFKAQGRYGKEDMEHAQPLWQIRQGGERKSRVRGEVGG